MGDGLRDTPQGGAVHQESCAETAEDEDWTV